MPGTVAGSPPLARVYDALDDDAYRAFRGAMRRSRGGVVRLEDLIGSLAEARPEATAAAFGIGLQAVATLARLPGGEPDLVPMANEPALREVLVAAYRQAEGRPVTSEALLAVIAPSRRPIPVAPPMPGLHPTPSLRPAEMTGEVAAGLLARWLAAQSLPAAERDAVLAGIVPEAARPAVGRA